MGTLFIVATPIGNLQDLSPRAIETLRNVALIAAEDTRHTRRLLTHFEIATPLVSYHAFNERSRESRILSALAEGDVALVSDAGTPGISDPGQALVAAALDGGHVVSPIPGPSSLAAAVSASGLVDGPMVFLGFLPRQQGERRRIIARASATGFALVLFESPQRVVETLAELQTALGDRSAVLCRELTKRFEEIQRGTLSRLAEKYREIELRGECVVVIGGQVGEPETSEGPEALIRQLMASGMKPSAIAREAAMMTGLPRSEIYTLVQSLRRQAEDQSG